MQLGNLVSDGSDIQFIQWKILLHQGRNRTDGARDRSILLLRQMVQFRDGCGHLGHQQQPEKMRVVLQEHTADAMGSQISRASREAFVECKFSHREAEREEPCISMNLRLEVELVRAQLDFVMTEEFQRNILRLLSTNETVFSLEVDSLLRAAANNMTALAMFRALASMDLDAHDSARKLRDLVNDCSCEDPDVLIGFHTGLKEDEDDEDEETESAPEPSVHYLRMVYSSVEAAYYLFQAEGRLFDAKFVITGSRKREGAIHHVQVELKHPRFLQNFIDLARECPHFERVEASTETEFWAAPSHSI